MGKLFIFQIILIGGLSSCIWSTSDGEMETKIYQEAKYNLMLTQGILRIKTDNLQERIDTLSIFNSDSTLFGEIYSKNQTEEPKFYGEGSMKIRSYYPDYYIVVLDSYSISKGIYCVIISGEEKFIKHKEEITVYESWEDHLKKSFITTDGKNPLRELPNNNSTMIGEYDYVGLNFEVIETKGEWAKVVCNIDCEGCPDNKKISGWLRWKKGKQLLVDVHYVC